LGLATLTLPVLNTRTVEEGGVGKEPRQPCIYGSDRNGGLYIFKEQGSGSG
jgi:hypothetical protein